jgi:hypothetical protein
MPWIFHCHLTTLHIIHQGILIQSQQAICSKKGSLHAQQCEVFFGAKRFGFGGKRLLQKSKSDLFSQ